MSKHLLSHAFFSTLLPRRSVPPQLSFAVFRGLHTTHHLSYPDPKSNPTTVTNAPVTPVRRRAVKLTVTQMRAAKEKRERKLKVRQIISAAKKAVRDEMLHTNQDCFEETGDPKSFLGQLYTLEKVREAGVFSGADGPEERRYFLENFEAAGNVSPSSSSTTSAEPLKIPLSHGIQKEEYELVFQTAPLAEAAASAKIGGPTSEERLEVCKKKADLVSKIVSLSLESQRGIKLANTRKAAAIFGKSEGDTGSPEAQCAILSVRIYYMQQHLLNNNRKDNYCKRRLTMMMHKRRKILRYLKNHSQNRYYDLLHKIGLKEVHYI